MLMRELLFASMTEVGEKLRRLEISVPELVQAVLQRAVALNGTLRAFITLRQEEALREAQNLQDELMKGIVRGPLHGIPISVKDVLQTAGTHTTAGSRLLKDWVPDQDAEVVRRLREAGAVIFGKNNLHEFAMGATSENKVFGDVRNPWDLSRIPGGSSGGSGVAVATGIGFGSIGTDTAGSIRLPAALCGVVGFKPTYGRLSLRGCVPFSWSMDHVGPLARSVEDAALLYRAMAGHDPADPTSATTSGSTGETKDFDGLSGLRIGICREYFFEGLAEAIESRLTVLLGRLEEWGAHLIEINIPGIQEALEAQKIIAQAEGYAYHRPLIDRNPDMYGDDVRFRLEFGRHISAAQYLEAQTVRRRFIGRTLEAMKDCEILLTPGNVNPPFKIGSVSPEQAIHNMFYLARTPLINLLGFPAVVIPFDKIDGGLPVGVQLVAKPFEEDRLLAVAAFMEKSLSWFPRLVANHVYEKGLGF
ncbi:amidase [Kyrpidia spormannii]|nr:amidase [Kyrpidia spormannii]